MGEESVLEQIQKCVHRASDMPACCVNNIGQYTD